MYLTKSNSILTSGPERNIRNQKYQYKVINLTSINNISPTFSLSSDLFIDNLLLPFHLFAHYRIHFEGVLSSFLLPTCHDMNAWFLCLCVGARPGLHITWWLRWPGPGHRNCVQMSALIGGGGETVTSGVSRVSWVCQWVMWGRDGGMGTRSHS